MFAGGGQQAMLFGYNEYQSQEASQHTEASKHLAGIYQEDF